MSSLGSLGSRLYRGEVSYDFIGHRKLWYTVSLILLAVSVVSLLVRGLTLGIEFRGGAEFRVAAPSASEESVRDTVGDVVGGEIVVQRVGNSTIRAQTETLTSDELEEVQTALAERFDVSSDDVSTQFIGPSWGEDSLPCTGPGSRTGGPVATTSARCRSPMTHWSRGRRSGASGASVRSSNGRAPGSVQRLQRNAKT